MSETDLELLDRYTRSKAEDAFTEIVRRHLDLVHSAALRQVRSPQLAEEVAQSTFLKLAHRAPQLAPDTILAAWLYHVTRQESVDVVRREARRQLREQIATEMNAMNATAADWEQVEPLLDEAMHALDETDRTAVLLRYFQNKSLREVGAALGTSDDTAQKRVSRAVERLREYFNQHGVNVGASGLVMVISANAIQAAPATLTLTISTAAAVAAVTTATQTTAIIMSWINAKTAAAIISAAVIAGTGTYVVQERALARAQSQQRVLLAQQAQLTTERDEALARAQATRLAEESARKEASDLARLRNEVTQLRQDLATEKQRVAAPTAAVPREVSPVANATPIPPGQYITRDQLTFGGYGTPEAALQSLFWSMAIAGDYEQLLSSMTPEDRAKKSADPKDREEFAKMHQGRGPDFEGLQVLARKTVSEDRVELKFKLDAKSKDGKRSGGSSVQAWVKVGDEWKVSSVPVEDRGWAKSGNVQKFVP